MDPSLSEKRESTIIFASEAQILKCVSYFERVCDVLTINSQSDLSDDKRGKSKILLNKLRERTVSLRGDLK